MEISELWKKLHDYVIPSDEEEELYEDEGQAEEVSVGATRRVANGSPVMMPLTTPAARTAPLATPRQERPRASLVVHENHTEALAMRIHMPLTFEQCAKVADDLMAKRATIVNYSRIEGMEQRRICDFLNGVCYVLDGEVRRISDVMMLYVPAGVSITTAKPKPVRR